MAETTTIEKHPVDVVVGQNLRRVRKARGWTQEGLAHGIGVSFQQVQKYERGANRISCSRLMDICGRLGIHPMDLLPPAAGDVAPAVDEAWLEQARHVHFRCPPLFRELGHLSQQQLSALLAAARAFGRSI